MSLPIKLTLPEHFLEEEVRCGYTVTTKLKKVWAVELDLLNELLRVCKKHNIKLIVFGGTLLGAVRHKGFIPWDDDLDVALTRDDFDKLCSIAPQEFRHPYFLQTALSDRRYFFSFARLRNSDTTCVISGYGTPDYNNGIYIDVYVLEGYTDSKVKWHVQRWLQLISVKFMNLYYQPKRRNNSLREIVFRFPRPFIRMFKYETLMTFHNRIIGLYTKSSSRIGLRDEMSEQAQRYWIYKSELCDLTELTYECISVPAPRHYEAILSRIYGDYNTFPPVEELGKWHEGKLSFAPDIPYADYFKLKVNGRQNGLR